MVGLDVLFKVAPAGTWADRLRRVRPLWMTPLPVVLFGVHVLWWNATHAKSAVWKHAWQQGTLDGFKFFDLSEPIFRSYAAGIFVLGFMWVVSALIAADLLWGGVRMARRLPERAVPGADSRPARLPERADVRAHLPADVVPDVEQPALLRAALPAARHPGVRGAAAARRGTVGAHRGAGRDRRAVRGVGLPLVGSGVARRVRHVRDRPARHVPHVVDHRRYTRGPGATSSCTTCSSPATTTCRTRCSTRCRRRTPRRSRRRAWRAGTSGASSTPFDARPNDATGGRDRAAILGRRRPAARRPRGRATSGSWSSAYRPYRDASLASLMPLYREVGVTRAIARGHVLVAHHLELIAP